MASITLLGGGRLRGQLQPPGDKSISHRSLLLATLANGPCGIQGALDSADVASTLKLCQALGARIEGTLEEGFLTLFPPEHLQEPQDVVNCGNSGTTARLGLGVLAGLSGTTTLTGDGSLRGRPMARVVKPLRTLGAEFLGRDQSNRLPLTIRGGHLGSLNYPLPVASGQVKGALLLAGLAASGSTRLTGRLEGRDHTERMFRSLGIELQVTPGEILLPGGQRPQAFTGRIPGDPSSAAFFLVAAAILPRSEVELTEVGLNPGRLGVLKVLQAMGADIQVTPTGEDLGEPRGTVIIRGRGLRGIDWKPEWVVQAIDEIPVLAVAACFAQGETRIEGAAELRVKESDRLATITTELRKLGAVIEELPDGLVITGGKPLHGAEVESHGDHRIAMALAIAALGTEGATLIQGSRAVEVSYRGFFQDLEGLREAA
jgi:3-phosphoshikimate 1-carboxyvinyltransferase